MSDIGIIAEEKSRKLVLPEPGDRFNDVEETIYRRRSVRFYEKQQVPVYLIRRILEAGRFAPSAGNAQTWKFVVVHQSLRSRLPRSGRQEMPDGRGTTLLHVLWRLWGYLSGKSCRVRQLH